ncbi:hypothetical protein [Microbispora hainanensis]|uniref:Methyltransferase MycE N-terminal domain-containing protein n=1 Tax=Microbispora hainanensis TaxID=568844 RepID=A0ABZ1SLY0_9ACTN|nr:hypothetical protein [Microbispora hainanensis]
MRALIAAAAAGPEALAHCVRGTGAERVVGWLVDDLLSRVDHDTARHHDEHATVAVQLELEWEGAVMPYAVVLAASGTQHGHGRFRVPNIVIRQSLIELALGLFGTGCGARQATSCVRVEPATESAGASMAVRDVARLFLDAASGASRSLAELAVAHGSDKWGLHYYTDAYERHFAPLRNHVSTVLELGIGGYGHPMSGGASLRMWKRYFHRAMVYGVDLFDKSAIEEQRITALQGDESDEQFLEDIVARTGPLDVVVDDGSHISANSITAFRGLWPHVRPGGYYVIEDLYTSYWPGYLGDDVQPGGQGSTIGMIKGLVDQLHDDEEDGTHDVMALHLYRHLVFIQKGNNRQGLTPQWVPRTALSVEEMIPPAHLVESS